MRKILFFCLLIGLLFSSIASASTLLTGKSHHEVCKQINFVNGTGVMEKVFEDKLKVVAKNPIPSFAFSDFIGIQPHENPGFRVYYFRAKGGILFGNQILDMVFGVSGIQVQLDNLTDKPMIIRWDESLLEIGDTNSMPFVDKIKFTKDGQPEKPLRTIIPPKDSVTVKLYSSANKTRWEQDWMDLPVPISDEGITRIKVKLKIETDGEFKYYAYESPRLDFPVDFVAANKVDEVKSK